MRNQLTKLNNTLSAPVPATLDALAERLQSVRETASLLYNKMVENMRFGQENWKTLWKKKQKKSNSKKNKILI